jgi:hypothetical protein
MDKLIITEKVLRDMIELMLDMQDSATRYDIINRLYRADNNDIGSLVLNRDVCKALFGSKESETDDDLSNR